MFRRVSFFFFSGITHAEITEFGFIRSLARYLYDTRIRSRHANDSALQAEDFFSTEHTVDDLYQLAYPELSLAEVKVYSLPFKYILDYVMTQDVLMDFKESTKRLSAAHFDNEAFANSSRRILQARLTSNSKS
jgi:hypothetical protein